MRTEPAKPIHRRHWWRWWWFLVVIGGALAAYGLGWCHEAIRQAIMQ